MNEELLNKILDEIKQSNNKNAVAMGDEDDNEKLLSILRKYNLEDYADFLCCVFGNKGYDKIREYEKGMY